LKYCIIEFSCSEQLIQEIAEQTIPINTNKLFFHELLYMLCRKYNDSVDPTIENDAIMLLILQNLRDCSRYRELDFSVSDSIRDYINENISENLTVTDIAEHFQYNKDYIIKLFKEKYGISIKKYVNTRRIAVAKRLLITSDLSVQQVGLSVGFDDIELFQKYFKYHERVTPQQYRNMNR